MEECTVKMVELSEMAKLTCLIREGTTATFIKDWKTLYGHLIKMRQKWISETRLCRLKRVVYGKKGTKIRNLGRWQMVIIRPVSTAKIRGHFVRYISLFDLMSHFYFSLFTQAKKDIKGIFYLYWTVNEQIFMRIQWAKFGSVGY